MSKTVCNAKAGVVFPCHWTYAHLLDKDNAPRSWIPATTWESKIKDITWTFDDSHPRFRHEKWREVFDKQLSTTPFSIQSADPLFSLPIGEDAVKFTVWQSREAIWERFNTLSQISVLEQEQLAVNHQYVL